MYHIGMRPGKKLRQWRLEKGYTKREAAKILNCTHPTIIRLEEERVVPSLETALTVLRITGIRVEEWLAVKRNK